MAREAQAWFGLSSNYPQRKKTVMVAVLVLPPWVCQCWPLLTVTLQGGEVEDESVAWKPDLLRCDYRPVYSWVCAHQDTRYNAVRLSVKHGAAGT